VEGDERCGAAHAAARKAAPDAEPGGGGSGDEGGTGAAGRAEGGGAAARRAEGLMSGVLGSMSGKLERGRVLRAAFRAWHGSAHQATLAHIRDAQLAIRLIRAALRAWALQVVRREFARWAAAIARWVSRARRRRALGAVFAAWGGEAAAAAAAARAPQ
jgi:hypothetical protein